MTVIKRCGRLEGRDMHGNRQSTAIHAIENVLELADGDDHVELQLTSRRVTITGTYAEVLRLMDPETPDSPGGRARPRPKLVE